MARGTATLNSSASVVPSEPAWKRFLAPDPWTAVAHASLVVAFVALLLAVPFFTRDGSDEFVEDVLQHAYVFLLLMAVTILGRTLPLRMLAAFFFLGMFLVTSLMLPLGDLLADVFGSGRMFDSFAVPILEEAVKAVPIALLFWFLIRRGWQPSMTDGLLLGFMVGAGLAIHENALYGRVYGEGTEESLLGLLFPTLGRESTLSRVEVFGFFHSGWGSLLGLSIGASFLLGRRFRWAYGIGVAGFLVVVLDHAIGNLIIENESVGDLGLLWALDLEGMLPVYLLVLGIPAAVIAEVVLLRRSAETSALPGLTLTNLHAGLGAGPAGALRLQAARSYTRARRALHYLLWAEPEVARPTAATAQLQRTLGLGRDAGIELFSLSPRPHA